MGSREEEIGEEHQEGGDGREFGSGIILGEMLLEDAFELDSLEDSREQRQGTDVVGSQFEAIGLGARAWDDIAVGAAW